MQVSTENRAVSADPGTAQRIVVTVVNTSTIIDGLAARLIGAGEAPVRVEPALLPLFPDSEGQFALTLDLPETQPAGVHPLTVEVVSQTTGDVRHADLELEVAPRPALSLSRSARVVRARRSGRFVLTIANKGNVALDVALSSPPAEAGTGVRLSPATLRVPAGGSSSAIAVVRGPRMITGTDVDRTVTVDLVARRVGLLSPDPDAEVEPPPEIEDATTLQLRQRPLLSRGLLTFLILAGIVALWATVFLLGLTQVFAGDPLTKTAPASFFTDADGTDGAPEPAAATTAAGAAADAPADALPKTGLLPPGVGGAIEGVVTAESDGGPVGRILVEAYRFGRGGTPVLVSSGATQSDGTYSLAGLFPTSYVVKFSARGYEPVWYPSARGTGKAEEVRAVAQGTTEGIDAVVTGRDAAISGTVDPGDALSPVPTRVVARLLSSTGDSEVAASTTTDASGGYRLAGLAAPGTYELSFVAEGYRATTIVQRLDGGENRLQPTVLLSAGGGRISGVVRDQAGPVGGVTVTTTVAGEEVSVITPTTGIVGAYSLQDLPTPGTYVVTFSAEGRGTQTVIVDLAAGESRSDLDQRLSAGTGSVSGIVRNQGGNGLGGVKVTVGGVATEDGTAPSTTTLTTGTVGSFAINNLPAPGEYTLTFEAPGFAPETRPITLSADGPAATVDFRMSTRLGGLTGSVTRAGRIVVGASVTATNGTETFTTTSSAAGGALPDGGYVVRGLTPGWYSVTVAMEGMRQQTALVKVRAGSPTEQDLVLRVVD